MIGTTLAHYRILEKLGAGGMGEVYLAQDSKLKRKVALKILPEEMWSDQQRLARFQREAESVAALNHPNIVTIHSVEQSGDQHFFTMEYVEGQTLDRVVPARGLPLERFFDLAIALADALASAHAKGVVHRDLKPGNIMVTEEGRLKVLDFGLAKLRPSAGPAEMTAIVTEPLTREGLILGTVPYMSPQQLEGKPVDARSDIFSLGVILYEMATGDSPFEGDTSVSLMSSILKDTPREVGARRPDLPHHLGRIVRRCLEKRPEDRYQSAQDVLVELRGLRREVESGAVSSLATAPAPARPTAPGRRTALWAALTALLLLAGAFAAWRLVPGFSGRAREAPAGAAAWSRSIASPEARTLFEQSRQYSFQASSLPRLELAEKTLRRALEIEPGNPFLQGELADLLAEIQRDYPSKETRDEAWSLAAEALETKPDFAAGWVARGSLLLLEERFEEAADAARRAQEADPNDVRAHILLGRTLLKQGQTDEGLAVLRRAIDLEGGAVTARFSLATALIRTGKLDEAASEYRALLELAPGHVTGMSNLAAILVTTGRYLEAVPLLRRVLELEPDESAASNLGTAYYYLGRMEDAVDAYMQAYEIDPNRPMIQNNLGDAYSALGDLDAAQSWYLKAIESADRQLAEGGPRTKLLRIRSVCEAKTGSSERALETILALVAESPSDEGQMELLYAAAQVHALAGDRAGVLEFARRAMRAGYPREEFRHAPEFRRFQEDPDFSQLLVAEIERP